MSTMRVARACIADVEEERLEAVNILAWDLDEAGGLINGASCSFEIELESVGSDVYESGSGVDDTPAGLSIAACQYGDCVEEVAGLRTGRIAPAP